MSVYCHLYFLPGCLFHIFKEIEPVPGAAACALNQSESAFPPLALLKRCKHPNILNERIFFVNSVFQSGSNRESPLCTEKRIKEKGTVRLIKAQKNGRNPLNRGAVHFFIHKNKGIVPSLYFVI